MATDDPRYERASKHAKAISEAAEALSLAIYNANRDGYRAALRVTICRAIRIVRAARRTVRLSMRSSKGVRSLLKAAS